MSADSTAIALFFAGFPVLLLSAHLLVSGSSSIALRLGIPELVVGMTVVALGTSAPELVISVLAALNGKPDVAVGNVIGSNLSNTLLCLGLAGAIVPLRINASVRKRDLPFVLLATLVLVCMVNDRAFTGAQTNRLERIDGLILLGIFAFYICYMISTARRYGDGQAVPVRSISVSLALTTAILSSLGLAVGGQWLVDGASAIALSVGASPALIGLTIVAVGTSLPELATSVVAAIGGRSDIAVGNVVGSNVFNILWILGCASSAEPIDFNIMMNVDLLLLLAVTVLLFLMTFTRRDRKVGRIEGVILVAGYAGYLGFVITRG